MKLPSTIIIGLCILSTVCSQTVSVIVENSNYVEVSEMEVSVMIAQFSEDLLNKTNSRSDDEIKLLKEDELINFLMESGMEYSAYSKTNSSIELSIMPYQLIGYNVSLRSKEEAQKLQTFLAPVSNIKASILDYKLLDNNDWTIFYSELSDKANARALLIANSMGCSKIGLKNIKEIENEKTDLAQNTTWNMNDMIGWAADITKYYFNFDEQLIYSKSELTYSCLNK